MTHFEAVIDRFGSKTIGYLLKDAETDDEAIQAARTKSDSEPIRIDKIRHWLQSYEVFQYLPGPQRSDIAAAVLCWADSQDKSTRLTTEDALCEAHACLMGECVRAFGKKRDFKSLASKALWLCYPDDVPIFDSFAQRGLWVLSKMDSGITPLTDDVLKNIAPLPENPDYRQFVHIWKILYDRSTQKIDTIEKRGYHYPVRVVDKILWIIGSPNYK